MRKFIQITALLFCFSISAYSQQFPFEVKISGSGNKNIVLIPGLSCSSDVWQETISRYSSDHKCYAVTFHGFAGIPADSNTTYSNWEHSLARYIRDNKIKDPLIIGHSIGGGLAMLLAADYPDLISKIVVVDALPCLGAFSNPAFSADPKADCSATISMFTSMSNERYLQMQKQTIPSLMADSLHWDDAIRWSVDSDRSTVAKIYCQFLNTDLRQKIQSIKCPSLVLLEAPFAGMKPAVEEQFKNMKTAQLVYSSKALHFVMYDDKDWYMSQLDAFLK
jgi:pimeloyl-ACP methyl ester carboxylesterase